MAEVELDRFVLEIFSASAEVVRAGIHRAAVADDGVDLALQGHFQQLLWIAVTQCPTGRDNAIDELWHWECPLIVWGNPEWFAASAGGQMIQAGIKNKYVLDMRVSASDMANHVIKRL